MPFFSLLGNGGIFWILLSVVLSCDKRYRKAGISSLIALTLMLLIGNIWLKPLVGRLRPFQVHPDISLIIPPPGGYSFPSGHSFSSFAAATAIFHGTRKFGIPSFILAGLIAFSRLYLYVHFPTDVLAGALFGILLGTAVWKLICMIWKKKELESDN